MIKIKIQLNLSVGAALTTIDVRKIQQLSKYNINNNITIFM